MQSTCRFLRAAPLVKFLNQLGERAAEFYVNARSASREAAELIRRVQKDARLKLAAVG